METTDAFLDRCITGAARVPTATPTGGGAAATPSTATGSTGSSASAAAGTSTSAPLPLAAAQARITRAFLKARNQARRENQAEQPLKATFLAHVASLRAEGIPIRAIATGLGVRSSKVASALKLPETQIEIVKRRELLKQVAAGLLPNIVGKGFALAEAAADEGDAKSFDAATRGLHALEKIGASVSGESNKVQVEHSGSLETTPASAIEELRVLIGIVTK